MDDQRRSNDELLEQILQEAQAMRASRNDVREPSPCLRQKKNRNRHPLRAAIPSAVGNVFCLTDGNTSVQNQMKKPKISITAFL